MSKAFGEHLRKLRKERSTNSQQNMADKLKISRSTYTYYETGKSEPGQATLKQLCDILSVDYNTLLTCGPSAQKVADVTNVSVSNEEALILSAYRKLSKEEKELLKKELLK